MMSLPGGAAVIGGGANTEVEGTRRFRSPISREMGARDIAQQISTYEPGRAPARLNPKGEEVLYVTLGAGACYIDGHRYPLERGVGVYIPPGSVYQIENSAEATREGELLEIVSVCCPEDEASQRVVSPPSAQPLDTTPFLTVREEAQQSIAAGDRTFKVMVGPVLGCRRVTQFVGVIPPGRAPMHHHTYEEAIYILEGKGRVCFEGATTEFKSGTSIYLPRGVSHCLENTGSTDVRLLGVFHPSGNPGEAYEGK